MKTFLSSASVLSDEEYAERIRKEREAQMAGVFADNWRNAGVPTRHQAKVEGSGEWAEMLDGCKGRLGKGSLLGLCGKRGNGKTQLAAELARHGCKTAPVRYRRLVEFYMDVKATFRREGERTERDVVKEYATPKLLVLDECHERAGTEWESSLLTYMIDMRYGEMKDTVLIANLSPADFQKAVGPSIASRMNETGGILECTWPSFRG